MKSFQLKIMACDRVFYDGECESFVFPGYDGEMAILAGHEPMTTTLEIGEIRKTEDAYFAFAGETIEVTQDEATAQSSGFMVYELVPVGEELKIKDYYNITN